MKPPFYLPADRHVAILASGQSNMNRTMQAEIIHIAANEAPTYHHTETTYHGGQGLSNWINGSVGSFVRHNLYCADIFNFDGRSLAGLHGGYDGEVSTGVTAAAHGFSGYDWELWLLWFQGETDAESPATYNSYQARFEFMLEATRQDLGCSRIRWCAALPHRSDAVNATGLAAVRAALTAAADADPFGSVVVSDDFARGDGVHISETNGDSALMARRLWNGLSF